jgi:hypothetical protein
MAQRGQFFVLLAPCRSGLAGAGGRLRLVGHTRGANPDLRRCQGGGPPTWLALGPWEIEVAEQLDLAAVWCVYNHPAMNRPAVHGEVGRELGRGERFTIPREPGTIGPLTPYVITS